MNHDRADRDGHDHGTGRDSAASARLDRIRRHDRDAEAGGGGLASTMLRTGTFVAAGIGMLLLGYALQPRFRSAPVKPEEERVLFPDLASDPAKAASLEIVSYDDELSTLHPFKVVQSQGVWVLPAHDNYPADAKEHLAAASTALVDLKMLDRVSESTGDHETFGVIEPDPEKIKPGMTGVGQLVEIRDASGNKLARLVIGKEDKRRTGEGGGKTLRFVRKAGQDPVYRAEIDTSKLTTKFGDWIEKDLLKLSPWDVRRIGLDDYALVAVESGGRIGVQLDRKNRLDLAYDDKNAKWSLVKLVSYTKEGEQKEEQLGPDEELAAAKLNDLRNALGDLKIVDVTRKPAGLSAELKAEESFTNDREAVMSLQQRGFLPLKSGEILSTDGETIVGMKDGVEYVLRFGAATTVSGEAAKGDADADKEKKAAADTTGRYLLVMARFNEDLLEKPQLEPLPDAPGAADGKKAAREGDADAKPAAKDGGKDGEPAAKEPAAGGKDSGAKDSAANEAGREKAADEAAKEAAAESEKTEFEKAGGAAEAAAEKPADAPAEKPAAAAPGDPAPDGKPPAADGKKPEGDAAAALKKADDEEAKAQAAIENRRRVERENRRKQDEYDDRVKAAQRRVRELNNRFADWYYVVPGKEYAKIHLGRAEAVQQAQPKDAAPAVPVPGE
jgi:hypothetical protein